MTNKPDAPENHPSEDQTGKAVTTKRLGTSKLQVAQSVGAAILGVQSSKNRKRDFQTGKPLHFIVGGILGTLVFILVIWLLVQFVLATA